MTQRWWAKVEGPVLAQGDLLQRCLMPVFTGEGSGDIIDLQLDRSRAIILTQSCDLENQKADLVTLCVVSTLDELEAANPTFGKRGFWENVRKGRIEGLHLLASPETPEKNRDALVVVFQRLFSVPVNQLSEQAISEGPRWRLESPFLEHFSQSFARFFMRVGLPSGIEPFTN